MGVPVRQGRWRVEPANGLAGLGLGVFDVLGFGKSLAAK